MALSYIAPLGLQNILNIFAGGAQILTAIIYIVVSVVAGVFRMPTRTFLGMILLVTIMLSQMISGGIYLLVMLLAGMTIFWTISRIVKY